MFFDPLWLLLMAFSTVIGLATQHYINSTFRRWSAVPVGSGMTGEQVAQRILQMNGIGGVQIHPTAGALTDHYDPRSKRIALSQPVHGTASVAAAGVAAHEVGHAIQDAEGYVWGRVRSALVPVASFGSQAAFFFIFIGIAISFSGLAWAGVVLYGAAVAFQVVTLPVELDASRRALASLQMSGALAPEQVGGARKVLTAAALTYVAAALVAALQLLYFIGLAGRRD